MTRDAPLVSVLMPVRNGGAFLEPAVMSILDQSLHDLELIVVNDGSVDDTSRVLGRVSDPRLVVLDQAALGFIAAASHGVEVARGRFLARMDADDISHRTRLEEQIAMLDSDPRLIVVGASYEVIDFNNVPLGIQAVPSEDEDLRRALYLRSPFAHGSVVVPIDAFRAEGGYRRHPAEDYDLWHRLSHRGRLAAVPRVLYKWRVNPAGISQRRRAEQLSRSQEVQRDVWRSRPVAPQPAATRRRAKQYVEIDDRLGPRMRSQFLEDLAGLMLLLIKRGPRASLSCLGSLLYAGWPGVLAINARIRKEIVYRVRRP